MSGKNWCGAAEIPDEIKNSEEADSSVYDPELNNFRGRVRSE
jgi:hypothetical protein